MAVAAAPTSPGSARRLAAWAVGSVAYVALAAGGAWLSKTSLIPGGYAPWWPPAGLMLGLFVVVGPRAYPLAVAGRLASVAVVYSPAITRTPGAALVRAVVICAAYLGGAMVLRSRRPADPLARFAWFTGVGVVASAALAAAGASVTSMALDGDDLSTTWIGARTFWIGDAVAVATIAPLAWFWAERATTVDDVRARLRQPSSAGALEAVLDAVALVGLPGLLLYAAGSGQGAGYLVLTMLPVLWVAVRHGEVAATLAVVALNVAISIAAAHHFGPGPALREVQIVMLTAAVAAGVTRATIRGHQEATAEQAAGEARYRSLVAHLPDHVLRLTSAGNVLLSSVETGSPTMTDLDAAITQALVSAQRPRLTKVLRTAVPETFAWELDTADGPRSLTTRLVAEPGRGLGAERTLLAVTTDLTVQRGVERQLDHERRTDALTGLANRSSLLEDLGLRLAKVGDGTGIVGALVVDLDQFTMLNSTLGQDVGDEVLRAASAVLRTTAGDRALAARLDGDEFAVAFGPQGRRDDVVDLATAVVEALRAPLAVAGHEAFPTASVGVAWTADGGGDPVELVRRAAAAMHAARELGGDRWLLFDEAHLRSPQERHETRAMVRQALARDRLTVVYQPVVDLAAGVVRGAEALVRIDDGAGSLIAPASFMAIAELYGLDLGLGATVLHKAVGQLATWHEAGWRPSTVSINATARQLADPTFADQLVAVCEAHDVLPSVFTLELTETSAVADLDAAIATMRALRDLGASCALDDFGTGYASIAYLRRLPVDIVKIDRSFVSRLPGDDDDRTVVALMIGVAKRLGCDVVAEGVETEAQRQALLDLGCTRGQGFLFGEPTTPEGVLAHALAGRA